MNSLPNHHFQNKSFYQLSFDGGHLTQYGGLIFFQELFSQLKLKERISKYLVTNDQRRYCRYSDSDILVQFLFQLLTGYGTDYIKLKKNTVLSRLGDLSLPCPQDEDLTILPHSAYSETLYQAGSWSHKRRVCQFSERKEGNLFYDVISLVTNMTSGTSQDQFQLYRGRGQAENFIKEMKEGFFGDKTDSSTLIKNEVRMMMSCIAYNLYLFFKHLAGGDFQTLTIKRFRHLFLHVVGKCVRTGRKQLLNLSSLYAYSELFSALYSRIRKVNLNLPVPYEPPRRKASLMMH